MAHPSEPAAIDTVVLHGCVADYQAGDAAAAERLLRYFGDQLERVARKMLRRFPGVARWEQTGDVLQNAIVRLLSALKEVKPTSTRAFVGLATEMMRRELLDLTRHYQGKQGHGANHASVYGGTSADGEPPAFDPPAPTADHAELERLAAFHGAVERLPAEEREVVGLTFYHGWTQAQIAELFQVDERTIRRRWRAACQRLSNELNGQLPDF